ncbi:MAG: hypothetical protein PHW62_00895 [Candidatus Ratteibacteria bacterium]|nr:hypothetical protein [Candidatus Ratteibacteria bacterium]
MPKLEYLLNKLGFTPEEVRLAISIEGIIFVINRKIPIGMPHEGVTVEALKNELNQGIKYTEDLLKSTLEKCVEHHILAETNGKFYSITYYGK